MGFRIVWDEESEGHIARHGLGRADVEDAIQGPHYWRNHDGGILILGLARGRHLFMLLDPHPLFSSRWRIRTARIATHTEKRLLRRRAKGLR